jgi:hypothetical protein
MYITTRNIAGGTLLQCNDCGHAISMNTICENPLQLATDMRKHIGAHNALPSLRASQPSMCSATMTQFSDSNRPFVANWHRP